MPSKARRDPFWGQTREASKTFISDIIIIMKKYIIIGVIFVLVLISYGLFSYTKNSNVRKEAEIVKRDEELAFNNKQKCASYLDDINKKLAASNEAGKGWDSSFMLEEVWFSKSQNSCLYSVRASIVTGKDGKAFTSYQIWDYLTSKQIPYFGKESDYQEERKKLD